MPNHLSSQVRQHISVAYRLCAEERGAGSFGRMKEHMRREVQLLSAGNPRRPSMFGAAAGRRWARLDGRGVGGPASLPA